MSELKEFDISFNKVVVGVDEVGRGPLAGPVVSAAVIINNYDGLEEVKDSKKLSPKKREYLYDIICENCEVGIGIVDNIEIDKINILNATLQSMKMACKEIKSHYDLILVDGNQLIPDLESNQQTIIKGDSKSLAIAAASIIAKVTRDRMMEKENEKYPKYFFNKHKGYGTKLHIDAIMQNGPLPIHRKSFLTKILKNG